MTSGDNFSDDLFNFFNDEQDEDEDRLDSFLSSLSDPEEMSSENDNPDRDAANGTLFNHDEIDEDLSAYLETARKTDVDASNQPDNQPGEMSAQLSRWLEESENGSDETTSKDSLLGFLNEEDAPSPDAEGSSKKATPDETNIFSDLDLGLPDWLEDADLGGLNLTSDDNPDEFDLTAIDKVFEEGIRDDLDVPPPILGTEEKQNLLTDLQLVADDVLPERDEPINDASLADLRFEALEENFEKQIYEAIELVGALKNVSGVIKPESIFEGNSLSTSQLVDELLLTPEQVAKAAQLHGIFSDEPGVSTKNRLEGTGFLLRIIVSLILLISVMLPVFFNFNVNSSATISPGFKAAYDHISQLSGSSKMLFIIEYGPESLAEMGPMTTGLLEQTLKTGSRVFLISGNPFGTTIVENIHNNLEESGHLNVERQWQNFGYLPGGMNGISSVLAGSMSDVLSPLYTNHLGEKTDIQASTLADLDLDGIVVISNRFDDARKWIEQLRLMSDVPVFVAASAAASPPLANYIASGQIKGLISGISDTVTLQTLEMGGPDGDLLAIWNSQALAGAGLGGFIIVVNAIQLIMAATRKKRG